MGLIVKVVAYYEWQTTYFVQCMDEQEAKEKAFRMFKQTVSCYLPDTLEEAEKNEDSFYIDIITSIDQIIL